MMRQNPLLKRDFLSSFVLIHHAFFVYSLKKFMIKLCYLIFKESHYDETKANVELCAHRRGRRRRRVFEEKRIIYVT